LEADLEGARNDLRRLDAEREALLVDLERVKEQLTATTARLQEAQELSAIAAARIETVEARAGRFQGQLDSVTHSRTWRTRAALLKIPGMARLARKAGRTRSQ
jgi:chromosome segregation ATPase